MRACFIGWGGVAICWWCQYLLESGQEAKAGAQKEKEGDYRAAINLYLKVRTAGFCRAPRCRLDRVPPPTALPPTALPPTAPPPPHNPRSLTRSLHRRVLPPPVSPLPTPPPIDFGVQGGYPAKAMSLVNARPTQFGQDVLEKISNALASAGMYDRAGSVLEQMGRPERAMEAFVRGHAYRNAVELARRHFPAQVVGLEQAWGDYLVSQKQVRWGWGVDWV
jgi:hypothetical protein